MVEALIIQTIIPISTLLGALLALLIIQTPNI